MQTLTIKNVKGFTLIEVLISVLILGIGILGVLNLQSRALMDNQDAYVRTQAIFLAYDMSDRIRANADYWKNPAPNLVTLIANAKAAHSFCSTYDPPTALVANPPVKPSQCTEQQMAEYDAYRWITDVANILPNGTVTITSNKDPNMIAAVATNVIRLTINWSRVNQDAQTKIGSASYFLEVRP